MTNRNKALILTVNYDDFKFNNFKKQEGGISWSNSDKNGYNLIRLTDTKGNEIYENCYVYIYITNLPSVGSNNNTQVLARAKITDIDYQDKEFPGLRCFRVGDVKWISIKDLKNYYNQNIFDKHNYKKGRRGIFELNNVDKYPKVLEELNNLHFSKSNFGDIENKYNKPCVLCKNNNNTFMRENGVNYFEIHHLLQQSLANEKRKNNLKWKDKFKNNIEKLIYNEYNGIHLCPYHHQQIHKGKLNDRYDLITKLLNYKSGETDNKDYKEQLIEKLKEINNNKDDDYEQTAKKIIMDIYKQYGIDQLYFWKKFKEYINDTTETKRKINNNIYLHYKNFKYDFYIRLVTHLEDNNYDILLYNDNIQQKKVNEEYKEILNSNERAFDVNGGKAKYFKHSKAFGISVTKSIDNYNDAYEWFVKGTEEVESIFNKLIK